MNTEEATPLRLLRPRLRRSQRRERGSPRAPPAWPRRCPPPRLVIAGTLILERRATLRCSGAWPAAITSSVFFAAIRRRQERFRGRSERRAQARAANLLDVVTANTPAAANTTAADTMNRAIVSRPRLLPARCLRIPQARPRSMPSDLLSTLGPISNCRDWQTISKSPVLQSVRDHSGGLTGQALNRLAGGAGRGGARVARSRLLAGAT